MKAITLFLISLLFLQLGACGGSSGDSTAPGIQPATPPISGIGRTGYAVGPVTTFGSIVVNGVRYETDNATFTVNDVAGTQDDLSVGHIVTVKGTINSDNLTGTADEVFFDDTVKGPVQSINLVGGQLVVLGQTILVSPDTSFDDSFNPANIDGVSLGQIVEVSGQFDANGNVVATRIEPKPPGTQFEVHGTVSNLDPTGLRFNLSNLLVDYSSATLDNFSGGQIANGDFVEAKGVSLGSNGELLATQVELETLLPGAVDGNRIEIEGFVTRFVSPQDFDVAGQTVSTDGATTFLGGAAADLGLNLKVEAEGTLDSNGTLVASRIEIRRAKAVRVFANVDSVNAASNSLVILGITVDVDGLTRLEDKSNADVDPLTLADVNAADYLEIRGDEFPAGSGRILATILEREDPESESKIQGFVESISDPSFVILGVTISTSGGTIFRDINDNVISSADFFTQADANSLVKATGAEVADQAITATEVEFELEF